MHSQLDICKTGHFPIEQNREKSHGEIDEVPNLQIPDSLISISVGNGYFLFLYSYNCILFSIL